MSSLPVVDLNLPCSEQAHAVGESISGSAIGPIRNWLLIEQRGRWQRDVTNSLPQPLALTIAAASAMAPGTRPLLIRRKEQRGPLALYLVRSRTSANPSDRAAGYVEKRLIDSYEDALAIDWLAALNGESFGERQDKPMYLVCTHGHRDRCCAKLGVPLWHALKAAAPATEVWQTSHIGGHRFAPTLVYLPHGICYGWVEPSEADAMAQAHRQGKMHALERCRGQTRWAPAAQAAALWWRQQHNEGALNAVLSAASAPRGDDRQRVTLQTSGGAVDVAVRQIQMPSARLSSCTADKPSIPTRFEVMPLDTTQTQAGS